MRLFYADDASFILLKIINEKINQISDNYIENDTLFEDPTTTSKIDLTRQTKTLKNKSTCQQIFLFNNSFQLEQVVLAMDDEVRTSIGRPIDETKIIDLLGKVQNTLLDRKEQGNEDQNDQAFIRDMNQLISELKLVFEMHENIHKQK